MAKPLTDAVLLRALQAEGCTVVEHEGWQKHNRNHMGEWGPVHGVMMHHTATTGHDRTVALCQDGYSTLPGPLCHGVICKAGHVHLISNGRANHAGLGDRRVLDAVIAESAELPTDRTADTDGNARFYGFECENLGDGRDPWPAAQLDAIERVSAAICRAHGWNEKSVIGHLEWQPGKPDPRGLSMAWLRNRIDKRLTRPAEGAAKEEPTMSDTYREVWEKDAAPAPSRSGTRQRNPYWKPISFLREIYDLCRALQDDVREVRAMLQDVSKRVG